MPSSSLAPSRSVRVQAKTAVRPAAARQTSVVSASADSTRRQASSWRQGRAPSTRGREGFRVCCNLVTESGPCSDSLRPSNGHRCEQCRVSELEWSLAVFRLQAHADARAV